MIEQEKQELRKLLELYQQEMEQKAEEWKDKWKKTPNKEQVLKESNRRTYRVWEERAAMIRDIKETIDY